MRSQKKLSNSEINSLAKIMIWLPDTKFGIFNEIAWIYEDYDLEPKINCDDRYCNKKECKYFDHCYYYKALDKAKKSDIIIHNHNSLAKNVISNKGIKINGVIIDQAHRLDKYFKNKNTFNIDENLIVRKLDYVNKNPNLLELLEDNKPSTGIKKINRKLSSEIDKIKDRTSLFFGILGIFISKIKIESGESVFYSVPVNIDMKNSSGWEKVEKSTNNFISSMNNLLFDIDKLIKLLKSKKNADIKQDFQGIYQELFTINKHIENVFLSDEKNLASLGLIGSNVSLQLTKTPAKLLVEDIIKASDSVNMTSTAIDKPYEQEFIINQLDLGDKFTFSVIKPHYKYEKQTKLIIPTDISGPNDPSFHAETLDIIKTAAKELKGHIAVSFGSKAAIKRMYQDLSKELSGTDIKVMGLGASGSGQKLLMEFGNNSKSIFLTTHDFIEENEMPEKSLKCLIIQKLPFEYQQNAGKNDFMDKMLPAALLKFKNIYRRLLRSSKDKGICIFLDNRVEKANYGSKFIEFIPKSSIEYSSIRNIKDSIKNWLDK